MSGKANDRFSILLKFHKPSFAWGLLVTTLMLAIIGWRVSDNYLEERARDRFRYETREVEQDIFKRMLTYENALRGAVGFINSTDTITREQWRNYITNLQIQSYFPGIQGVGFSYRIPSGKKELIEQKVRNEGYVNFAVKPSFPRDEYHTILYLHPLDQRNLRAFGFDMFSEQTRQHAMKIARDSARPALSGKVKLVQETSHNVQNGFLLYLPVYKGGQVPTTVKQRRVRLKGYVYAPFRANDLMRGILGARVKDVGFELYDGLIPSKESALYDSDSTLTLFESDISNLRCSQFNIAGRSWTIIFEPLSGTISTFEKTLPIAIAVIGALIDFLLFLIILSITESHKREKLLNEELIREKERNDLVAHATSDVIWDYDVTNGVILFNDNYKEKYGFENHFNVENQFFSPARIHEDDVETLNKSLNLVISNQGRQWSAEYRHMNKKGEYRYVYDRAYILYKEDKSYRIVGALSDITERKENETKKDLFLSIASHELKTPLTSLKAYIQILQRQLTSENYDNVLSYVDKTNHHVTRLTELITDLLDVSKIQSGKMPFTFERIDFIKLVQDSVEFNRIHSNKHKLNLHIKCSDVYVWGDIPRLEQVITNLISNAVKYSPNAEQVDIEIATENDSVYLKVKDYGIGIPEEKLPHIFDRFYRVEESSNKFSGLGLGLFISSEIIKRHDGNLNVCSQVGVGSEFCFSLPMLKDGLESSMHFLEKAQDQA